MCVEGLLLEMRVVCYSLMHQHSTHLDLNPTGNSKRHTHTHSWLLTYIHGDERTHTCWAWIPAGKLIYEWELFCFVYFLVSTSYQNNMNFRVNSHSEKVKRHHYLFTRTGFSLNLNTSSLAIYLLSHAVTIAHRDYQRYDSDAADVLLDK